MTDFWRRTGLLPGTAYVVAADAPASIIRQARILKARYGDLIQICDGVADNIEIQAAIAALPAVGGKVLLTGGTFTIIEGITLPNTIPVHIQGVGEATRVYATAALPLTAFFYSWMDPWNPLTERETKFSDFLIEAATAGAINGILARRHYIVVENMFFRGVNLNAIYTPATGGINNSRISDNIAHEVRLFISLYGNVDDVTITGNIISKAQRQGISIHGSSTKVSIVNNAIEESCVINGAAQPGLYVHQAYNCTIVGNVISETWYYHNVVISDSRRIVFANNIVFDAGIQALNTYDGIILGADTQYCVINQNVSGKYFYNSTRYGININPAALGNKVKDNVFQGNVTASINDVGIDTEVYSKYIDLFMDVLAISATHVVNAQTLAATPTACVIAAQPDVPRALSYAITHPTLTAFTLTFVGVNAKGKAVTEVFTQAAGWNGRTGNAFATVTSITMSAMIGNTIADSIDVGITDVLGLSNKIYATTDVYKIKKNNANAVVAVAQVNTTYDTYDMAVIGLAVGDDFTIWFRSNLNMVS